MTRPPDGPLEKPCETCGRSCKCRHTVWLPLADRHADDANLLRVAPSNAVWTKDHKQLALEFAKFLRESTPAAFYRAVKNAVSEEAYE